MLGCTSQIPASRPNDVFPKLLGRLSADCSQLSALSPLHEWHLSKESCLTQGHASFPEQPSSSGWFVWLYKHPSPHPKSGPLWRTIPSSKLPVWGWLGCCYDCSTTHFSVCLILLCFLPFPTILPIEFPAPLSQSLLFMEPNLQGRWKNHPFF